MSSPTPSVLKIYPFCSHETLLRSNLVGVRISLSTEMKDTLNAVGFGVEKRTNPAHASVPGAGAADMMRAGCKHLIISGKFNYREI